MLLKMLVLEIQHEEPVWFDQIDALPGVLSNGQSVPQWATQRGSMTAYLERVSNAVLEVKLISQLWEQLQASEALRLGVSPQQSMMAREVALFCGGKYCMWAKTFFPERMIKGDQSSSSHPGLALLTLGMRPLGKLLFQDPHTERSPFEWSIVDDRHGEYKQALKHTEARFDWLFARRSTLRWQGEELLLKEVFLLDLRPPK